MPELDIYVIGSMDFVYNVLYGITRIFGYKVESGNNVLDYAGTWFGTSLKIMIALGILTAVFKAITEPGKGIEIGSNFAGLLLLISLFSVPVKVTLKDAYIANVTTTGLALENPVAQYLTKKTVDGVPIAVAAPGYLLSLIGRGITEGFYSNFRTDVNKPRYQMAEPLYMLTKMREVATLPDIQEVANDLLSIKYGSDVDFRASVRNYMEMCTMSGLVLYERDPSRTDITPNSIKTKPFPQSIKFDSDIYQVYVQSGTQSPGYYSCTDAWEKIFDGEDSMWSEITRVLSGGSYDAAGEFVPDETIADSTAAKVAKYRIAEAFDLAITGANQNDATRTSAPGETTLVATKDGLADAAGQNILALAQDNLKQVFPNAMTSPTRLAESAQAMVFSGVIMGAYNDAIEGRLKTVGELTTAIAIRDAQERRNVEFAAEGTMFENIARPMAAFFEGFVYALAPLMALLVGFGGKGLGLVMKYFALAVWVQLWMPIMAITDLYITTAAEADFTKLGVGLAGSIDPTSPYLLTEASDVAQAWIAIGGMMLGATSSIALMLVYGSAVAATSLAGRLNGKDYFNETNVAPEAQNTGPVLQNSAMMTGSYAGSAGYTGAAGQTHNLSQQASRQQEQAQAIQRQTSAEFGATLQQRYGETNSSEDRSTMKDVLSQGWQATDSKTLSAIDAGVKGYAKEAGFTKTQTEALQNEVRAQAQSGAGLSIPGLRQLGVKVGGEANFMDAIKESLVENGAASDSYKVSENGSITLSDDQKAQIQQSIGAQSQTEESQAQVRALQSSEDTSVSTAAKQTTAATERASDATALARSAAATSAIKDSEIGKNLALRGKDDDMHYAYQDFIQSLPESEQAIARDVLSANREGNVHIDDPREREMASRVETLGDLYNNNNLSDETRARAMGLYTAGLAMATGDTKDYSSLYGNYGNVGEQAKQLTESVGGQIESAASTVEANQVDPNTDLLPDGVGRGDAAPTQVQTFYDSAAADVRAKHDADDKEQKTDQLSTYLAKEAEQSRTINDKNANMILGSASTLDQFLVNDNNANGTERNIRNILGEHQEDRGEYLRQRELEANAQDREDYANREQPGLWGSTLQRLGFGGSEPASEGEVRQEQIDNPENYRATTSADSLETQFEQLVGDTIATGNMTDTEREHVEASRERMDTIMNAYSAYAQTGNAEAQKVLEEMRENGVGDFDDAGNFRINYDEAFKDYGTDQPQPSDKTNPNGYAIAGQNWNASWGHAITQAVVGEGAGSVSGAGDLSDVRAQLAYDEANGNRDGNLDVAYSNLAATYNPAMTDSNGFLTEQSAALLNQNSDSNWQAGDHIDTVRSEYQTQLDTALLMSGNANGGYLENVGFNYEGNYTPQDGQAYHDDYYQQKLDFAADHGFVRLDDSGRVESVNFDATEDGRGLLADNYARRGLNIDLAEGMRTLSSDGANFRAATENTAMSGSDTARDNFQRQAIGAIGR